MIQNISSEVLRLFAVENIQDTSKQEFLTKTISNTNEALHVKLPKDLKELMNTLLKSVSSGEIPLTKVATQLPQNVLLKQAPSLVNDIEKLLLLIKKEPILKEYIEPLKTFIKDIKHIKEPTFLQEQIEKSGVKLETNLKNISNTILPSKTLLAKIDILQKYLENENLPKTLNEKVQNAISTLNKNENTTSLKNILSTLQTLSQDKEKSIQNSSFSKLLKNVQSLESLIKKYDLISSKMQNQTIQTDSTNQKPLHVQFDTKVKETLKNIDEALKVRPLPIPKDFPREKNVSNLHKEVVKIFNDISLQIKELKNVQNIVQQDVQIQKIVSQAQIIQNTNLQISNNHSVPLSVQEKLKSMVIELKASMKLLDAPIVKNFESKMQNQELYKDFKNIYQMLEKNIRKDVKDLPIGLEKDVKYTLLKVNEKISTKDTQIANEIKSISQKAITQIEMHQLISYASNSLHVYIPFLWDGLKEGALKFKASENRDNFSVEIDLDLKIYGKVNVMLVLFDKDYINVNIALQSNELKEKIESNLNLLREGLSSAGFIPVHVKSISIENTKNDTSEIASSLGMNLRV